MIETTESAFIVVDEEEEEKETERVSNSREDADLFLSLASVSFDLHISSALLQVRCNVF
jgi:hypothetical protein